jgi:rhamnulose-1-phosphate aldolase
MSLVEILPGGNIVMRLWGSGRPTSEFPAHLSIHAMCASERPEIRAVLHTHPPNLVAMSHLPDMQAPGALNNAVRRMHPECFVLVPKGIEHVGFRTPGSMDLGEATRDALRKRNVALWSKHGIVSIAPDLEKALDQVEILEKAATIYLLARGAGIRPVGISDKQISETCKFWEVEED